MLDNYPRVCNCRIISSNK